MQDAEGLVHNRSPALARPAGGASSSEQKEHVKVGTEQAPPGAAPQGENNAGVSLDGDSAHALIDTAGLYQASGTVAETKMVAGEAELRKFVEAKFESVPEIVGDLDNEKAAEDASVSSLLASNEDLSRRAGMIPKSSGIFSFQEPGLFVQHLKTAESEAPDQQGTSPLGLRKRRCVTSLGLLDLPYNALEGGVKSYVSGVGSQASSVDEADTGNLQLQASELWKHLKRPLSASICSTMCLLLILTAFVVIVTACAVSILFTVTVHTKLQILSDELRILRKGTGHSVACPSPDYPVDGTIPEDQEGHRRLAFYGILCFFLTPFLFFKYGDHILKLTGPANNTGAEDKLPFSKQVAYKVDVLFSYHSFAKPLALLLATVFLIGAGGVALFAVGAESLTDTLWVAWTYVADAGNHADSVGFGPRLVSVCISFGGMLIFALMVGLVSDAISEKVDSLRKGKSQVLECNHTLILGWSDKLGSILRHLAIANRSLGGGVVVVLSERDKETMEADIAKLEFDFMGTFVICRSGSPLIMADLKKVSVSKARSIIVLAEIGNADQSDARALRVVLNLTGVKEGLRGHVVVELSDVDNEQLVKLVGGQLVETLVAHDVIGRLMIQCARQPGLALIWEDILGFQNAEFYFRRWPQLDGMRFEDVLISFPAAVPVGVKVATTGGKIIVNPEDDYVMSEGDELLVLAEDDDTYSPGDLPQVCRRPLPINVCSPKLPERILFCGWRRDIDDLIQVVDEFLASGSELWLFNEVPLAERNRKLEDGGLCVGQLVNTCLVHREGNAVIRRHLECLPLETFDSILILADEALEDTPVYADSRSVATLLLIRDIQSKRMRDKASQVREHCGGGAPQRQTSWILDMEQASHNSIVISEILDSRTKNLVSVSAIGDYVLSNELVSMALAMVAEEKQINRVLEELFAKEGNELYIRKAGIYLHHDHEELSFYDVLIRARQRKEIVVGYRRASDRRPIINPPDKATPVPWSLSDVFIVLSQEE